MSGSLGSPYCLIFYSFVTLVELVAQHSVLSCFVAELYSRSADLLTLTIAIWPSWVLVVVGVFEAFVRASQVCFPW